MPAPRSDQVVYVLDQDLIRFGKFALAILAIFVAVGAFFYGVDIKKTAEDARKSADEMRDVERKASQATDEVLKAKQSVSSDRSESEKLLAGVKTSADAVSEQLQAVQSAEQNTSQMAGEIETARKTILDSQQRAQALLAKADELVKSMSGQEEAARRIAAEIETAKGTIGANREEVEKLATDMGQRVKTVTGQQEQMRQLADQVAAEKESIDARQKEAEALLAKAESAVKSISEQEVQATTLVARIRYVVGPAPNTDRPGSEAGKDSDGGLIPANGPFSTRQLAELYNFPTELDGRGQTIGLIELGGGYRDSDLDAYFKALKLRRPTVVSVPVDGASNHPGNDNVDGEVTMNIEIAGGVAPAARIAVYFAPNTDAGFVDAISAAASDRINHPSVLLIGWGGPEDSWAASFREAMNTALQRAAEMGITTIVAAGDTAGARGDFPATSPWVVSCGGTRLTASGRAISSEVLWNDEPGGGATASGASAIFPLPEWQSGLAVPPAKDGHTGRAIPDVAASASPRAGYSVLVHGKRIVSGGSTGSASLWAGLIALLNQGLGRNVGYLNPILYKELGPAGALHSITEGNTGINGVKVCSTGPGWNSCTGWGSPDGRKLLEALRARRN